MIKRPTNMPEEIEGHMVVYYSTLSKDIEGSLANWYLLKLCLVLLAVTIGTD